MYDNVDAAYSDFIVTTVISEIAPLKYMSAKNDTSELIDDESFECIKEQDKLLRKCKKSRLHTDNINYKRARYHPRTLIKNKKRNNISNQLTENIAKPKRTLENYVSIRLTIHNQKNFENMSTKNDDVAFEAKSNCKFF